MDLESINCPQYMCFDSDLFENKVNKDPSSSECDNLINQLSANSNKENFSEHAYYTAKDQLSKLKKRATMPKPFKFETDTRLKVASTLSRKSSILAENQKRRTVFLPLARQIIDFHKKTPERFYSTSRKSFKPSENWSPPRLRSSVLKNDVFEHGAVAMKANDKKLWSKETMKKEACIEKKLSRKTMCARIPESKLTLNSKLQPQKEDYIFRARPVPKNIFSGPTGLGQRLKIMHTVAKSPNFVTGKRLEKRKLLEQMPATDENPSKKFKVEENKLVVPSKASKPKFTKVQPFSFDKVHKEKIDLKGEKHEEKDKPFVFKATQLPKYLLRKSTVPQASKIPKAQAFDICWDDKNSVSNVPEKIVPFKARPADVLKKKPFIPVKPSKQKIEFQEFNFCSGKLATERAKIKEQREKSLAEKEALKKEIELQDVAKLRQQLVHRSSPARQCKPIQIRRSMKPLTVPISPKFATNKRIPPKIKESE